MPEMTKEQARMIARKAESAGWGLRECQITAIADLILQQRAEAAAEERERVANLQERLRLGEELLSEILRLALHLERRGQAFLTAGHANRIRAFLCLLPREELKEGNPK